LSSDNCTASWQSRASFVERRGDSAAHGVAHPSYPGRRGAGERFHQREHGSGVGTQVRFHAQLSACEKDGDAVIADGSRKHDLGAQARLQHKSHDQRLGARARHREVHAATEHAVTEHVRSAAIAEYAIDPRMSRFTVRGSAGGLLSSFGHNPILGIRDFTGQVRLDPEAPGQASLHLAVRAGSLEVQNDAIDKDRRKMKRVIDEEVLEIAAYPEISYQTTGVKAARIAAGSFRLEIDGRLSLHGATRPQRVTANVTIMGAMLRANGEFSLQQTDYRIRPASVAGGALKLKDELKFSFDIARRQVEAVDSEIDHPHKLRQLTPQKAPRHLAPESVVAQEDCSRCRPPGCEVRSFPISSGGQRFHFPGIDKEAMAGLAEQPHIAFGVVLQYHRQLKLALVALFDALDDRGLSRQSHVEDVAARPRAQPHEIAGPQFDPVHLQMVQRGLVLQEVPLPLVHRSSSGRAAAAEHAVGLPNNWRRHRWP